MTGPAGLRGGGPGGGSAHARALRGRGAEAWVGVAARGRGPALPAGSPASRCASGRRARRGAAGRLRG